MKLIAKLAQGAALFSLLAVSGLGQAATTEKAAAGAAVEEIVVTGSYIKGSAENTALPIDVVTNQELQDVGNPSMIEFIRTLGITSGNLAESNQFNAPAQGEYGVTTINLRGLGSARTLTLINGHRQVATENFGVDVSAFPMNAFGRTEILKDGAAALYGSDAIAGVVNFITREGFEGVEITGSNQWIDNSDGNQDLGLLMGWSGDDGKMDSFVALEFNHRSRLDIRNRDWGLKPFADNYNGGWSTTGMPGTTYFYNPNISLAPGALPGTNQEQYRGLDPACASLGTSTLFGTCDFQFTYFDSLIEDTKQYKSYGEFNYQLNDATKLHFEAMYSHMDMPSWQSSPAYPPNSLFGPDRIIPANSPGLMQYKADYPDLFACVATNTCSTTDPFPAGTTIANVEVYQRSRMRGVQGQNGKALRTGFQTNTYRLATDLSGEFGSVGWDAAVSFSHRERITSGVDMGVQKMAFALNGLGGPNCDPQTGTPGVGPCMWFNPFSEAVPYSVTGQVATNPTYCGNRTGLPGTPGSGLGAPCLDGTVNTQAMYDWLNYKGEANIVNELLVWDFVLNGDTGIKLPGGTIGWAAGLQARNEHYKLHLNDVANINVDPCPWTNQAAVDMGFTTQDQLTPNCTVKFGLLAFGVPGTPTNDTRDIYAAFSEFQLPITDTVNAQLAVRFEDYGTTGGGSTIDPKLAIKWQAVDWLALRGSISTTFRGPPQSYLSGVNTYLQNIPALNAYRAVNINGNPDLEPETAVASNVGVIIELGGFYGSIDYWNYKFSKPFQIESATQIIDAYAAHGCQGDGSATNPYGPGVGTPVCDQDLRPRFVPFGTPSTQLASVDIYWINGSDINTNGLDFLAQYDFDALGGQMTAGVQGTYTIQYVSDDFQDKNGLTLAPGGDFAGWMNIGVNPFYPLPDLKGNAFVRYTRNNLRLSYTYRYVNDYRDAAPPCPGNCYLQHVQNWTTQDVTAIYTWNNLTVSASVFNLTDEDPPEVYLPQNYDPYTVDPIGRNYKLQLTYTLGGG